LDAYERVKTVLSAAFLLPFRLVSLVLAGVTLWIISYIAISGDSFPCTSRYGQVVNTLPITVVSIVYFVGVGDHGWSARDQSAARFCFVIVNSR
jgi:hypothetical protein